MYRFVVACLLISPAGAASPSLEEVLARLDKAAPAFRSLKANLKKLTYTAVIKESAEESGAITLLRPRPKDLRMLIEISRPDQKGVYYQNRKLQIYYPKMQTVQEFDLGKQGALVDQFLLLGFGSSAADLKAGYEIKLGGEEQVGAYRATRLELTPKSAQAREHVRLIELWISDELSQPVQQKIHQPSRDYILITYSDLKINPGLTEDAVRLNLPKGVKREYPQR
jgi:outer membrane lipoprotein-sorting protein